MNTKINLRNSLKTLPLISVLVTGLALSPMLVLADSDGQDGHHKQRYSHGTDRSYTKHQGRNYLGKNTRVYNEYGKRYGKHYSHRPKPHYNNWPGHRRTYDHRPVYVIDNYYSDLDRIRLMIGLHTDSFDITFRD
ncbi:MAG TPA: hypothetical protein ENJ87_12230 [Gammaproteobacteria bacterium]|nr:hypothetical protein [Gammaproteobacteria bacterium]